MNTCSACMWFKRISIKKGEEKVIHCECVLFRCTKYETSKRCGSFKDAIQEITLPQGNPQGQQQQQQ